MVEWEQALNTAKTAALAAADILRQRFTHLEQVKVERKPSGELVTASDLESERLIQDAIARAYPTHDILGEEFGLSEKPSSLRWFIDPIDGTGNFSRGNPNFSVSIALAEGDTVLVGVIAVPMERTVYHTTRGGGAFRNDEPIHVSDDTDLAVARVLWCEGHAEHAARAKELKKRVQRRAGICERIGSAALECASVATGASAAYFTTGIRPWDIAAGKLLIEEAGGVVTDFTGNPFRLTEGDFLASNGKVHDTLVSLLKQT